MSALTAHLRTAGYSAPEVELGGGVGEAARRSVRIMARKAGKRGNAAEGQQQRRRGVGGKSDSVSECVCM